MNNIDDFRAALAAHVLSKHAATDEQTGEDIPLPELVALHEHAHSEGEGVDHRMDSLEEGPLTKVFTFDLPVQVFGHSAEDAWRRFADSGLTDGDATIKQDGVAVPVVFILMTAVSANDVQFAYDYPLEDQAKGK